MGDRLIIYDSFSGGHHPELIIQLLRNWPVSRNSYEFVKFILNPSIVSELSDITPPEGVEIIGLPQVVSDNLAEARTHKEHIKLEQDYLLSIANDYKPTIWLWMALDAYQVYLASQPFKELGTRHIGILFMNHLYRPFHLSNARDQLALRYKLMKSLSNSRVETIFVLNDEAGAERLRKQFKDSRFKALPEPIANGGKLISVSLAEKNRIREKIGWPIDRKIALLFGALSPRKNALGCLEALELLPKSLRDQTTMCIHASVVKPKSHLEEVKEAIENINAKSSIGYKDDRSDVSALIQIGRISESEVEDRFAACDVVLAPYLNFFSASGVMNHAIQHQKHAIIPHKGLMASLSKNYELNYSCRSNQPKDLARAWADASSSDFNEAGANSYLASRTPEHYARTLLYRFL